MTPGAKQTDEGSAIIEFVFVAVIVMIPLIYLIAAVATAQRSLLAVRDAAREAGRAFASTDSASTAAQTTGLAMARAEAAMRLALAAQGLPDDAELRYVALDSSCDATAIAPVLAPGAQFVVCVRRRFDLPGVPSVVSGRGVTTMGRYVLHIDDYRSPNR